MRGTPLCRIGCFRIHGIIPAYAGNTRSAFARHTSMRDHPRVCGEHSVVCSARWSLTGSSPRMRGTPRARPGQHMDRGIIPAYAGNTHTQVKNELLSRDHPRVCGEHRSWDHFAMIPAGSSPRMRGTLLSTAGELDVAGIIPAYAGNTLLAAGFGSGSGDHPRVCGEHTRPRTIDIFAEGSSPRMRGTPGLPGSLPFSFGIIPAYAGNTRLRLV